MPRVASLFLPQLPIERLRRTERPRALPEPAAAASLPVDDDPGACSVPRGGGWRPGARWAQEHASSRAATSRRIEAMPAHRRPPMRELGRRSEPADHPFRAMPADEGGRSPILARPAPASGVAPLVLAAKIGRSEVVTAACPAAVALGLAPGSAVSQARALVPDLEIRPADPEGDAALLDRLAAHAGRFWAPTAAVSGNDGIWLDLTGAAHLYGGEHRFCRRVVRFLARLGLTARIAIADTPGAAHAVARFGAEPATLVPPGGATAMLARMPVEALRLDEAAIVACRRFGLEHVADLLPLPRAPLTRRLGRAAVERLDQAIGRVAEPIAPLVLEEAPCVELRLLEPIGTPESIEKVIEDLLGDLVPVLRERGLGVRSLHLLLDRVDAVEQRIVVGTSKASRDACHLGRLLKLRMDRIEPGLGIEAARLVVQHADRLGAEEFGSSLAGEAAQPDVAMLVDRIAGRAGPKSLFRTSLVESDVPERAVRRVGPMEDTRGWPQWRRPSRLLGRPEPLSNVVALLPDHPPRRFTWRGEVHEVVGGDGPERIYGEWWVRDGEVCAVRDYYRIEDRSGGRYWIFRRGDGVHSETGDLTWYLHGAFG